MYDSLGCVKHRLVVVLQCPQTSLVPLFVIPMRPPEHVNLRASEMTLFFGLTPFPSALRWPLKSGVCAQTSSFSEGTPFHAASRSTLGHHATVSAATAGVN
jgi:hypothetical protein